MSDTATIETPPALWNDAELAAWAIPEQMKPSAWVAKFRYLPRNQSKRGGSIYSHEHAPYMRDLLDLSHARGVEQMNVMKFAQGGISEGLIRNDIAYCAANDPDPMGLTLPDRDKGRKIVANRVAPMFSDSPELAKLTSEHLWDIQNEQIKLRNGFILHLMWSGSASSMASDPICRVWNDEVDKHKAWVGRDASASASTWARILTYEERKFQGNVSTPTVRDGEIYRLWEASTVHLYYFVPCPKCGTFQRLLFPQLRYDSPKRRGKKPLSPRALGSWLQKTGHSVWYECEHCGEKIHENEKAEMVRAGHWATEDGSIADAAAVSEWPRGTRIGIQISALYCLWDRWADIMAEYVQTKDDPQAAFDFRTQKLGEPFEERITERLESDFFSEKSRSAKLEVGVVPEWAAALIGTIDTQKDHFKVVVRAWGPTEQRPDGSHDVQSQRVWHGRLDRFTDLDQLLVKRWPVEGNAAPPMTVSFALVDTGGTLVEGDSESRTLQVYRWAWPRRQLVRMIKGTDKQRGAQFFWEGKGQLPSGQTGDTRKALEVPLWFLATHHWNDMLADLMARGGEDDDRDEVWFLNRQDDPEYNAELSNMHKTPKRKGLAIEYVWRPTMTGVKYDYRHCEVYQVAASWMRLLPSLLPPLEEYRKMRAKQLEQMDRKKKPAGNGKKSADKNRWAPGGWLR